MFDQAQMPLGKRTLDTNTCYFRRLFLIEIISKDRLMAVEENGLKKTKNHIWCKNIIYINKLLQIKYKV